MAIMLAQIVLLISCLHQNGADNAIEITFSLLHFL